MRRRGFTLIELMVVVAIIGLLSAIAAPKFAELIRKSNEGRTKGNLGSLRSAISIYYSDMEGHFPTDDLSSLLVAGKYLSAFPLASTPPFHSESSLVRTNFAGSPMFGCAGGYNVDDGKWGYWSDSAGACAGSAPSGVREKKWGEIWVTCTHTDSKSGVWTSY